MVEDVAIYRAPTPEALNEYVLKASHSRSPGEAFCEQGCRRSSPHRQPGVVAAQSRDPEFCPRYAERYRL